MKINFWTISQRGLQFKSEIQKTWFSRDFCGSP